MKWACRNFRRSMSRTTPPGPGWSSCGSPSRWRIREEGEDGEEGWLDADARAYADKLAQQVRAWIDEAPVLEFDQAAADRR